MRKIHELVQSDWVGDDNVYVILVAGMNVQWGRGASFLIQCFTPEKSSFSPTAAIMGLHQRFPK